MPLLRPNLCPLLTDEVCAALKRKEIKNASEFLARDLEVVAHECQLNYRDLVSIRRTLLKTLAPSISDCNSLFSSLPLIQDCVSSGINRLDDLLDGGLHVGEVTEFCGGIAVGKTQVCMSCASITGGQGQNVLYIDTSSSFSAIRAVELLQQDDESVGTMLDCIRHCVCTDIFEILDALELIKSQLKSQSDSGRSIKLIIVDSVASVIYPILGGNQLNGHSYMVQLGQTLKMLAVEFSIAVLITNNVVCSDDGKWVPSLGKAWSHVPHTRVCLSTEGRQLRKATLIKSSRSSTPKSVEFSLP